MALRRPPGLWLPATVSSSGGGLVHPLDASIPKQFIQVAPQLFPSPAFAARAVDVIKQPGRRHHDLISLFEGDKHPQNVTSRCRTALHGVGVAALHQIGLESDGLHVTSGYGLLWICQMVGHLGARLEQDRQRDNSSGSVPDSLSMGQPKHSPSEFTLCSSRLRRRFRYVSEAPPESFFSLGILRRFVQTDKSAQRLLVPSPFTDGSLYRCQATSHRLDCPGELSPVRGGVASV